MENQKKDTCLNIIRAATISFSQYGLHRTSMQDIANQVGIRKSALYHHFIDKREIINQALNSEVDYFYKNCLQSVLNDQVPIKERIDLLIRNLKNYFIHRTESRFFVTAIIDSQNDTPSCQPMLEKVLNQFMNVISHIYTQQGKEISEKRVKRLIANLLGSVLLFIFDERQSILVEDAITDIGI